MNYKIERGNEKINSSGGISLAGDILNNSNMIEFHHTRDTAEHAFRCFEYVRVRTREIRGAL
ncbi:MAG: hypothetical protein GXP32_02255 [Kiritimatiellaeota bacterium]|nr:hypothetical protein [Kiritimatiellota bacterium]